MRWLKANKLTTRNHSFQHKYLVFANRVTSHEKHFVVQMMDKTGPIVPVSNIKSSRAANTSAVSYFILNIAIFRSSQFDKTRIINSRRPVGF